MKKNKIYIPVTFTIIFIILYILFAAKPLAKEYSVTPQWKINTSNPVIQKSTYSPKYFHLGQTAGYFTEDGNITHFKTFPSKISISDKYYALYDSNAKNTDFFLPDGTLAGKIEGSGYPYFKDDLIFLFLPGGNSFVKCLENGKKDWIYEGTMPITAFSTNKNFTAIGLADGCIKVFENKSGNLLSSFEPGGSEHPVILGIDVSEDGQYIASVSGLNRQRFVLWHKEESQQKIIFHTFLDSESPYQTIVHFCKDGKRVLYNYKNKLGIFDISENQNATLNLKSKLLSVDENDDFVFLLGKNKDEYTVSIIESTNSLFGSFSFEADAAFIHSDKNNLYVGKNNSISKLTLTK